MHDARAAMRLRAAQQRAHAGGELRHRERFHHVVVGAEVQAVHAVIHRVARGEHEHRHGAFRGAKTPQYLETVHLRQPDVENHQVEALLRRGKHCLLAARSHVYGMALGLENPPQARSERRVVFDDQ